jgi:hypothetical protein
LGKDQKERGLLRFFQSKLASRGIFVVFYIMRAILSRIEAALDANPDFALNLRFYETML